MIKKIVVALLLLVSLASVAQLNESIINYSKPQKYKIGGISVSGTQFVDASAIIAITGLRVGDEVIIPGESISGSIKKLWDQGILADVQIKVVKIEGEKIFFDFYLKERPRLSKFVFFGIKQSEQDDLKEKVKLIKGKIVTDVMIKNTTNKVKNYFSEKGFKNIKVNIIQAKDSSNTSANSVTLRIVISKGRKIRVDKIDVTGNYDYTDLQIAKKLKHTRNKNLYVFRFRSKFVRNKYEEDKKKLAEFYNNEGYRDFTIVNDTVYPKTKKYVNVKLNIHEGKKYYFRDITWSGNYKYDDKFLSQILGIKKGDIYNISQLEKRTNYNPTGVDVSSLYLDDGYLFFSVEPVEINIENDSVDIEMKVYEGPQATINKIIVNGNTKTNDHVLFREIRTKPGQKFSRADLIRTQREIATLGFFDPEQIGIAPKPNPANGTVDIEYTVAEKPSDQIELSGGWGGFYGFIGTVGITFNNFSARNITNFSKWSPLPAGDGQRFSFRLQSNGPSYQSLSTSFSEPWLGGRKPTSLTVSASYSVNRLGVAAGLGSNFGGFGTNQFNPAAAGNAGSLSISNISISLGRRIKWPDDFFTLSHTLSYSYYVLDKYLYFPSYQTGFSNNLVLSHTLSRNNVDNPQFPKKGSSLTLTLFTTPPYSFFSNIDYGNSSDVNTQQYKWVEYYKIMFDNAWYLPLPAKFVLQARTHFGFMGRYNSDLQYSPYERFLLGGNGLSGFNSLLGSDVVGLRGYGNNSIGPSPNNANPTARSNGGIAYDKFVFELRYPITMSQAATVYALAFAEGGNNWGDFAQFNPLNLKKTVGLGARIFMPAFGLIGVDYGWALDTENGEILQPFTFSIGQQIR
jgi:outer membrane protein insertion porin family